MKRVFAMFVLTPSEQRLVIFVVLVLILGVWIKHDRDMRLNDLPKTSSERSLVSPTPNEH
jgi:hypothetical protein